ncbi:hypothetical protein [Variovorax boronicumulans]|uniref:hypothetical protein n=1 Tax=Variovorax boronicumulans TaxID=436515 RepID=UPI0012E45433|nr:hypothetical protein [Variovorax boronicumulans]GER16725.1 hypothetical protein VCH24_17320 [Variovorax boronicumulans]
MSARDPVDLSQPAFDADAPGTEHIVLDNNSFPQEPEQETANTSLVVQLRTTALAELTAVDAGIAALHKKYADVVFAVDTAEGMEEAKAARIDIRDSRYKIAPIVKAKRAELKSIAALLDTEGERIAAALLEIETPIHEQIRAQEAIEEAAAAERKRLAEEATARIDAAIAGMRNAVTVAAGKKATEIANLLDEVGLVVITTEAFGKRAGEAMQVQLNVTDALAAMHDTAVATEAQLAELTRMKEEKAERDRVEAEAAAARAELEAKRIAAEAKAAADAAEAQRLANKAEADRVAAEQAKTQQAMAEITRVQGLVAQATSDGTVPFIEKTVAEVTAWQPGESSYGFLLQPALLAKDTTLAQLGTLLAKVQQDALDAAARAAAEADAAAAKKKADDEAAAAEQKRLADEREAQAERDAAEARERLKAKLALEKAERHAAQMLSALRGMDAALESLTDGDNELSCIPEGPERTDLVSAWDITRAVITAAT